MVAMLRIWATLAEKRDGGSFYINRTKIIALQKCSSWDLQPLRANWRNPHFCWLVDFQDRDYQYQRRGGR